jgi:PIN domain nuclease of toxin-antitoxin system
MFKLFNIFNWVTNLVESFTFYGGGKGGGGGGGQPQTQTSYSTNLPEYAKPYYEELLKQTSKQVYKTDPEGNVTGVKEFVPYTGERIAGFTPGQEAVQTQTAALTQPGQFAGATTGLGAGTTMGFGAGMTGLGQAFGYSPMAISGGTFDAPAASYYMSPYQTGVTDIAVAEARKQAELDKSAGALGAIGRGTFGGARQALLQAEQGRGAAQNISNIRARGQQEAFMNAQQQFERDQARRMQAAQLGQQAQQFGAGLGKDIGLAGLTAGLQGSQALGALGAQQQQSDIERLKAQAASAGEPQALQQERLNQQYQQFMDQQNFQKAQMDYLSQILRGNAGALGQTQVQYAPAPSLASQLGGLGLAGLGLYNVLGGKK